MKIWGEVPKISPIYNKNRSINKASETSSTTSKQDKADISKTAKDFQTIMKALKDVPDVREDKVAKIMDRYEAGEYSVSGEDVIDKLFNKLEEKKI